MPRIPFPSPETMTPEQRQVYDAVVAGPRGVVVGPLRAALHNPELAERWQRLGECLRFNITVPARLRELAILVTARRWNSQLEWLIHEEAARKAGLAASVIAAIHSGEAPVFEDADEADVYEFARELQQRGQVAEPLYRRVADKWQALGVVELTALIGYYTMVSMTLNAHEIPLPEGREPPLVPLRDGLSTMAPGRTL